MLSAKRRTSSEPHWLLLSLRDLSTTWNDSRTARQTVAEAGAPAQAASARRNEGKAAKAAGGKGGSGPARKGDVSRRGCAPG
mmetsp:Transcript_59071/g.159090  ORF Transcript_59071/g.159090 Transcript_59071/m.159090 type:complete len:82 (+) Transcript_59071:1938-2183(+)